MTMTHQAPLPPDFCRPNPKMGIRRHHPWNKTVLSSTVGAGRHSRLMTSSSMLSRQRHPHRWWLGVRSRKSIMMTRLWRPIWWLRGHD